MKNIGKDAFVKLMEILPLMTKLNQTGINEEDELHNEFYNYMMLPLPSGDYGNVLALALEMNYYVVANHLIDNNKKYGINLDTCAISKEKEVFDVKSIFAYSLDYFNDNEELGNYETNGKLLDEIRLYKNDPIGYYRKNALLRNIEAKNELETKLGWKSFYDSVKNNQEIR